MQTIRNIAIILYLSIQWAIPSIGQPADSTSKGKPARHFIAVNPLNIFLFQQAGASYEFKPGHFGYGLTAGYIYPNEEEYSNYFIAGPTDYGSLGWYHGFFAVPQVNYYFSKPGTVKKANLVYLSIKAVYKYMTIDSVNYRVWDTHGESDTYWEYRKMADRVNIVGGFIDFGFKFIRYHMLFDLNFGPGLMYVNHTMDIAGVKYGYPHDDNSNISPPRKETLGELNFTINFSLNIGIAL